MNQVKFFSSGNLTSMESNINEWLKTMYSKKFTFVDVKYDMAPDTLGIKFSAMLVYNNKVCANQED